MLLLLLFAPKTMIDVFQYLPEKVRESDELKIVIEDPLCTRRCSLRYLNGLRSLVRAGMNKAALVQTPILIIQGDADREVDPAGAVKLLNALGVEDKSLKMFPGADHHFYDALSARATSKHDPAKRAQVAATVSECLRA